MKYYFIGHSNWKITFVHREIYHRLGNCTDTDPNCTDKTWKSEKLYRSEIHFFYLYPSKRYCFPKFGLFSKVISYERIITLVILIWFRIILKIIHFNKYTNTRNQPYEGLSVPIETTIVVLLRISFHSHLIIYSNLV